MSTTNVTLGNLFETIGRLHIQVEALQAEIAKRDTIISGYLKAQEAAQAAKVPPPPEPVSTPEPIDHLREAVRQRTPDA